MYLDDAIILKLEKSVIGGGRVGERRQDYTIQRMPRREFGSQFAKKRLCLTRHKSFPR